MKSKRNRTIGLGILCALLVAASAWYTVTYNEARFLVPMEMSDYVFRVQDLPMIGSGLLLALYVGYVVILLVQKGQADQRRNAAAQHTRTVDPKLGFLGLIFLEVLLFGQGKLLGSGETTLAALVAVISLSIGLGIFLREYLLYRYDHDELLDEGEE